VITKAVKSGCGGGGISGSGSGGGGTAIETPSSLSTRSQKSHVSSPDSAAA